jgi:hypothetical protein
MSYKKGDSIISLIDDKCYIIKYILGSSLVVVSSGKGYDMPIRFENIVPCSPLMEELI